MSLQSSLLRILHRLFPPFEVKATRRELEHFLSKHSFMHGDIVRAKASVHLSEADRIAYSIRVDGWTPEKLALVLVTNALGVELQSGHYHVYRGVLGPVGQALLQWWTVAVDQMRKRGYYNDAEAAKDMQWIRDQIEGIG